MEEMCTTTLSDRGYNELDAVEILRRSFLDQVPVVAILGQSSGWTLDPDPVLKMALDYASRTGLTWRDLLKSDSLPANYYEWLADKFQRRLPSQALEVICDTPFSAVFTSSVDPGIANLFSARGREPEPILLGDFKSQILRSRRRRAIYFLFGRAGNTTPDMLPPLSLIGLAQRRIKHSTSMLKNIEEAATPLGLIVVDGFNPIADWLRAEDLLTIISCAPKGRVLWCGPNPIFGPDDNALYEDLLLSGVIIRDPRSIELIVKEAVIGLDIDVTNSWDEPGIVTVAAREKLVVTPPLRLVTQASATIIDDEWTGSLPHLDPERERIAFHNFHAGLGGLRNSFDGVRRGFSIERDFEDVLWKRVNKAFVRHHAEQSAIVVHGQSGVGKSIALSRLALKIRQAGGAVLFAQGRLPQASDVTEFLEGIDNLEAVTLVIADSTVPLGRYDDLLRSLRSLGHRVVVVGSCYRIDQPSKNNVKRLIDAPALLLDGERTKLRKLIEKHAPEASINVMDTANSEYALAGFYRLLPESRGLISAGLGREALLTEHELRLKGAKSRKREYVTALGLALSKAGLGEASSSLFYNNLPDDKLGSAAKVIDYVMSASRLFRSIPIGLVLRAVSKDLMLPSGIIDSNLLLDLFEGQDIFRWKYADNEGSELLIGARLQIEAEIICNRRLDGPRGEAEAIISLIRCAYRAGHDDNEETSFVADIVQAIGPDGPMGDRYKDYFVDIARMLTQLRLENGIMNGRFMLQESALRRAYIRKHEELDADLKAQLLVEATLAVDSALEAIDKDGKCIYASRRTKEHLLVEKAATYGFLAIDTAKRSDKSTQIWSSYQAARAAVQQAAGWVDSYVPLDVAMWIPRLLLKENIKITPEQKLELEADLFSTFDLVDSITLDPVQLEKFHRQRLLAAEVMGDPIVDDEAFEALDAIGSSVGYYLRARRLAPDRTISVEGLSDADIERAAAAAAYLDQHYSRISTDPRCIQFLLAMEWIKSTRRWLFQGLRQPLPYRRADRIRLKNILLDLSVSQAEAFPIRYRYLDAVLTWLEGSEEAAIKIWRQLSNDSRYSEARRVSLRHIITDENQQSVIYSGIIERQITGDRWSIYVEKIGKRVDILSSAFPNEDISVGRTVRNFSVAFTYRGPIAIPITIWSTRR